MVDNTYAKDKWVVYHTDDQSLKTCTFKLSSFFQLSAPKGKTDVIDIYNIKYQAGNLGGAKVTSDGCSYQTSEGSTLLKVDLPSKDECTYQDKKWTCKKFGSSSTEKKVEFFYSTDNKIEELFLQWYLPSYVKSGSPSDHEIQLSAYKIYDDQDSNPILGNVKITKSDCSNCKWKVGTNLKISYNSKQKNMVKMIGKLEDVGSSSCSDYLKPETNCYYKKFDSKTHRIYGCSDWTQRIKDGWIEITFKDDKDSKIHFEYTQYGKNGGFYICRLEGQFTHISKPQPIDEEKQEIDQSKTSIKTNNGSNTILISAQQMAAYSLFLLGIFLVILR